MDPEGEILSVIIISAVLSGISLVDASLDKQILITAGATGGNPVISTIDKSIIISSDSYAAVLSDGAISEEITILSVAFAAIPIDCAISKEITILSTSFADTPRVGSISKEITFLSTAFADTPRVGLISKEITILSATFSAITIDGALTKEITFLSTVFAVVQGEGTINNGLFISANVSGGQPDKIATSVVIYPNIAGSRGPDMEISAPVVFNSNINAAFGLYPRMQGDISDASVVISTVSYGQYGFLYTGVITAPIVIELLVSGLMVPRGIVNKAIPIACTAVGISTSVESLYGVLNISCAAVGKSLVSGSITKPIVILSNSSGQTQIRFASANKPVVISSSIQGFATLSGYIGETLYTPSTPIIVTGNSTNRARSFLAPGVPVPLAFRHGQITTEIVVGSTATTADQAPLGIINANITISPTADNFHGRVLGFAGTIATPVVIVLRAYDADYGVSVPKVSADIVIKDVELGVKLTKSNVQAVLQQRQQQLVLSKSVVYAVIAPAAESNPGYQAILFF